MRKNNLDVDPDILAKAIKDVLHWPEDRSKYRRRQTGPPGSAQRSGDSLPPQPSLLCHFDHTSSVQRLQNYIFANVSIIYEA
jgi:hypothetical protein